MGLQYFLQCYSGNFFPYVYIFLMHFSHSARKSYPFYLIHVFNYLFMLLGEHGQLFHSIVSNPETTFLYSSLPSVLVWTIKSYFRVTPISFRHMPIVVYSISLLSGTTQCFRLILYFLCYSHVINYFYNKALLLLLNNSSYKPLSSI